MACSMLGIGARSSVPVWMGPSSLRTSVGRVGCRWSIFNSWPTFSTTLLFYVSVKTNWCFKRGYPGECGTGRRGTWCVMQQASSLITGALMLGTQMLLLNLCPFSALGLCVELEAFLSSWSSYKSTWLAMGIISTSKSLPTSTNYNSILSYYICTRKRLNKHHELRLNVIFIVVSSTLRNETFYIKIVF